MQRLFSSSLIQKSIHVNSRSAIRRFCASIQDTEKKFRAHSLLQGLKANVSNDQDFINQLLPYLKDPKSLQVIADLLGQGGFLQTADEVLQTCKSKDEALPILWSCSAVLKSWLEAGTVKGIDVQELVENTKILSTLEDIIKEDPAHEKRIEFALNYQKLLTASYASFSRQSDMSDLTPIDALVNFEIYPPIIHQNLKNQYLAQQTLMSLMSVLPLQVENEKNDAAVLALVPDLVELLRLHGDEPSFASLTMRVLCLITMNVDGLNIEKAFECGILTILEALCLEHLHDKEVTFTICSLIRNLTAFRKGPGSNNRELIYQSKIVAQVTNILRTHFQHEPISWSASACLLNLSLPPPDQTFSTWLKSNGILEVIHKLMKQHKDEARILQNCCGIIMGMGYFNSDVQDTILEMRIEEFLVHDTRFMEDPKIRKFLEWYEGILQTQHYR